MNAKKKILAVALAASMAVLAVGGSSLAYFTDTDSADNVFTVGNVKIDLTEPKWDEEGEAEAEDMYPGEAVAKDPTVTNVGDNPAVVRIKVEWPGDVDMIYRTDYADNKLGEGWELKEDGYFYYNKPLKPTETTDALFDQVVLSTATTNGTDEEKNIKVTAQAIQAQGIFSKYDETIGDGINTEEEWDAVISFFNNATELL